MEKKLDLILHEIRALDRQVSALRTEIQEVHSMINSRFDNLKKIISNLQVNLDFLNSRIDLLEEGKPHGTTSSLRNKTVH